MSHGRDKGEGKVDFGSVSLFAARKAAQEPPPGVKERFANNPRGWETVRRHTRGSDLRLDDEAVTWLAHLPARLQPRQTARQFPRVVNRLARVWSKTYERMGVIEEMLFDTRHGRQGFPKEVLDELHTLRKALIRASRADDAPASDMADSTLATTA
jgi:hypothetical protein